MADSGGEIVGVALGVHVVLALEVVGQVTGPTPLARPRALGAPSEGRHAVVLVHGLVMGFAGGLVRLVISTQAAKDLSVSRGDGVDLVGPDGQRRSVRDLREPSLYFD